MMPCTMCRRHYCHASDHPTSRVLVSDDELSVYVLKLNSNFSQGPCQSQSIADALRATEPASQLLSYIHGHAFLSVTTAQALREMPNLTGKSCLLFSRLLPAEQKIEPDVEGLAAAYASSNASAVGQDANGPSSEDFEQEYAGAIQDGAALLTIIIPKPLTAMVKEMLSAWQATADGDFGASLTIMEEESGGMQDKYVDIIMIGTRFVK